MARTRRTTCKVNGCRNPLHIYPSGVQASYCDAHLYLRKHTRHGYGTMTGSMREVLAQLDAAQDDDVGHYFIALDVSGTIDRRTISAMIRRDWIIASHGLDGIRYKITGRGVKAFKAYSRRLRRLDGICPECGKRARHVRRTGVIDSYCVECGRAISNRKRKRIALTMKPGRKCSCCKERPPHRYPGGTYSTYCCECESRLTRERRARRKQQHVLVNYGVS